MNDTWCIPSIPSIPSIPVETGAMGEEDRGHDRATAEAAVGRRFSYANSIDWRFGGRVDRGRVDAGLVDRGRHRRPRTPQ